MGVPLHLSLVVERRRRRGGGGAEGGGEGGEEVEVEAGLRTTRAVQEGKNGEQQQQQQQQRRSSSVPPPGAALSDGDEDDDDEASDPGVVATGVVEGARLRLPAAGKEGKETSSSSARRGFSLTFLTKGTFSVEPRGVVATTRKEAVVVDSSSEALYVFVE